MGKEIITFGNIEAEKHKFTNFTNAKTQSQYMIE